MAASTFQPHVPEAKLVGVKGWLLLFCIILTLLLPAATIFGVTAGWRATSPLFARVPGLAGLIMLDAVVNIVIAAWAIYVGVRLWLVKPGANKAAESFLITLPILRALFFVLVLFSDVRGLGIGAFISLFQTSMFALIWHAYLDRSQRVRATFARTADPVPAPQIEAQ